MCDFTKKFFLSINVVYCKWLFSVPGIAEFNKYGVLYTAEKINIDIHKANFIVYVKVINSFPCRFFCLYCSFESSSYKSAIAHLLQYPQHSEIIIHKKDKNQIQYIYFKIISDISLEQVVL